MVTIRACHRGSFNPAPSRKSMVSLFSRLKIAAFGATAGLFFLIAPYTAKAGTMGIETYVPPVVGIGQEFRVDVIADSTNIPENVIKDAEWDLTSSATLTPYMAFNRSELPDTNNPSQNQNDFFYGILMESAYNYVDSSAVINGSGQIELDNNCRLRDASNPNNGAQNKRGILGSFYFKVDSGAPLGAGKKFGLHAVFIYDTNGVAYKLSSGNLTILNSEFTLTYPGDANLDFSVDVGDLAIMGTYYGLGGQAWSNGDFNGDGVVDVGDLAVLGTWYGSSYIPPSGNGYGSADSLTLSELSVIPEPAALGLLALAGLAVLKRRRRKRVGRAYNDECRYI